MGQKAEWQLVKDRPVKAESVVQEPDAKSEIDTSSSDELLENENDLIKRSTPRNLEVRSREMRQQPESSSARILGESDAVQRVKFPAVQETPILDKRLEKIDYLKDVDLEVSVELGNTILSVESILSMDVGSVIELNQTVGEEVKILINGNSYAYGEVVVIGERFGVRLTRIVHE